MGISLHRFPEHRLELFIYSGRITVEEMLEHFKRLDAGASWLSYFDSTCDLSGLDLTDLPTLKRAITAKDDERKGDLPRRHALVNVPRANEPFARFWCAYASAGVPHAHRRDMFPDLGAACRWLGAPHAACKTVIAAAEAEAQASGAQPARLRLTASPGSPGPGDGARPAGS